MTDSAKHQRLTVIQESTSYEQGDWDFLFIWNIHLKYWVRAKLFLCLNILTYPSEYKLAMISNYIHFFGAYIFDFVLYRSPQLS